METFDCNNIDLHKGSKGAKVTLLQTHLKNLGYYTYSSDGRYLKLDGDFGTETEKAVIKFQGATGHSKDGQFGPKTCKSLNEKVNAQANAAASATNAFNCPNINLSEGSKGENVTKLQTALKSLGYYTRQVDGDYGPYTTKAVIAFQAAKGLTQDGQFGPVTCAKLQEVTKTNNTSTATKTSGTPASVKKTDPYKVDTSKNVTKAAESNINIDGLYFLASSVTFTNPHRTGSWKRIDLMNGGQYTYLSNPAPLQYSLEIMLTLNQYTLLENEFYKMQFRVCNVVSTLIKSGKYTVEMSLAYQNVKFRKITLALTEYME